MIRALFLSVACLAACDRAQGVADQDLGALVIAPTSTDTPTDVALAAKDPTELGRALLRPYRATIAAIGAHSLTIATTTTVEEAGKPVDDRSDKTTLELGDAGAYHATYENSSDYGREAIFLAGTLYLRPRYQRWHARGPEAPDEPATLRDQFAEAIGATWDLLAPGAELTDLGHVEIAGRPGRKIGVKLSPRPATPATETVNQRKWREHRSIEAVTGEIVLDADEGVPLAVKLAGTIGFGRDGRQFKMKLSIDSTVASVGTKAAITAPAKADVVATPERMREVDDHDFLLDGIAPAIKQSADATSVMPPVDVKTPGKTPEKTTDKKADKKPDEPKKKKHDDDAPPPAPKSDTSEELSKEPPP